MRLVQKLVLPLLILILIGTAFAYAEEDGSKDVANLNITIEQPVDLRCVYSEGDLYNAVRIDGKSLEEWNDAWPYSLDIKAVTKGPREGTVTVKGTNDYTGEVTIPAEFKFKPTDDEILDQLNLKVVNFDETVSYTGKTRDPIGGWDMDLYFYSDKLPEYNGGNWYKDLKEGRDYELVATSFTGGKKIGKAKVKHTLRFMGDFEGTVTTSFSYKVVPKTPKVKKGVAGKGKITITIAKQTGPTDGFRVRVFDRDKRNKLVKTKVFKGKSKTKLVVTGLKKGHWYDAYVDAYKTVGGKKYWSYHAYTKKVMKVK